MLTRSLILALKVNLNQELNVELSLNTGKKKALPNELISPGP